MADHGTDPMRSGGPAADPRPTGVSAGRFLVTRALTGFAVAVLLLLPATGAPRFAALGVPALLGLSTGLCLWGIRIRPGLRSHLLAGALAFDILTESYLVAVTGASQSPFILLFSLTIAASGLMIGAAGSVVLSLGAIAGYWTGILTTGVAGPGAPILVSLLLLLLGLLSGLLARRQALQSAEVVRVRDELERVLLDAETLVASLKNPLLCLDREGRIRRANAAASRMLGAPGALEGMPLSIAADQVRVAPLLGAVEESFRFNLESASEILLPAIPGIPEMPVEVFASNVRDRNGNVQGLVLLLNDLTRRKQEEAEQAGRERLAVIGELSGHLTHEIRNSLKPLVGSCELLSGEIPASGVAGELLAIILREAESLELFLNDFLTFARDKTLTFEDCGLDELIEEEIQSLSRHPARSHGVGIRSNPGPSQPIVVRTDRRALRAILRNLIVNALEATSDGWIELSWQGAQGDVEILVEDMGQGLPDGDPEALFEPFCSHKPGGTGLGLAIARRLAHRLHGEVILERRGVVGTRAQVRLSGACTLERAA